MKKIYFILFGGILSLTLVVFVAKFYQKEVSVVPIVKTEKPFEKYSIENLKSTKIEPGDFNISNKLAETENYNSYLFNFQFKPDLKNSKMTSGQINIPSGNGSFPLIVMIRGYVDQKVYKTGDGTRNVASSFAKNGFITISPDFLGYAGSDSEAGNIFEVRFQTYVTVLSLLNSFTGSSFAKASEDKWDGKNIFIWAHSNGGQIVLTALTITGIDYPTVLWAPVTKPFPYSVLYYTDESNDGGKLIRRELSKFEDVYNTDLYSFTNYLEYIKAPIQLCQGTNDNSVPREWSKSFYNTLKSIDKDVEYIEFPGADHNMKPSWNETIGKNLIFFRTNLKD